MKSQTNLKLGDKAKDTITGYEGVITGMIEYLHASPQALLEAPVKEGKKPESMWCSPERLVPVEL